MTPQHQTQPGPERVSDTVENAAATPDQEQPYAELGLRPNEYQSIRDLLGRRPTAAELAMYSVMWSEHCSYKSSKKHLAQFGEKTTEEMRKHLLVGIGQNAGVVDIGDGWAVTYKVESHNSPSYIEPFQGAATGVGGIVRDIISMGARPVAVMDQLRFGEATHPDTARVLHGAVAGIGSYANSLGVPNIGGETEFDSAFQRNPLVNAMCVGVMRHEDIHLANAEGPGNKVILFGARTGGDGIGGASILASETFDEDKPVQRPNVQVGDPFTEKLLIEACLELYGAGVVEAIQDLGAAGISCATSELASNGSGGMHVDLETVLLRDPSLSAGEILMSESQERMMAVVRPEKLDEFLAICTKWDVESSVIGEVNDSGRLTIDHFGQRIVDVDPRTVAHEGPVYDRPYARPAWQDALNADHAENLPRAHDGEALRSEVVSLLGSINLASKSWFTSQFDRYVQGNTVLAAPHDAGVVRVDEETGRGVAIATDANGRFTKLDPYAGAQASLAEAYRNVATTGAIPRAVSDCLNNGSPEDPDAMWQLVQIITGLADGCKELGIPVTGGNVSLYNSTHDENVGPGHINASINPTPVIAVLGVLDDVAHAVPSVWAEDGLELFLLGETRVELSGSEWARALHKHLGGLPPKVDLQAEKALAQVLVAAATGRIAHASHDLSTGGLIQALTEAVVESGVGVRLELDELLQRDGIDHGAALFSESGARALVAVSPEKSDELRSLAQEHGVMITQIGHTGADVAGEQSIIVPGQFVIGLNELRAIHEEPIPSQFG